MSKAVPKLGIKQDILQETNAANQQLTLELKEGPFRVLEWEGAEPASIFLHGLTGVAEVWNPTISALGKNKPYCLAYDQRGHGDSPYKKINFRAQDYLDDLIEIVEASKLSTKPHLVGHSLGGRIAILAAARYPEMFSSATIIDIGPETWKGNWEETVSWLDKAPKQFKNEEAALQFFEPKSGKISNSRKEVALARIKHLKGNTFGWRGDVSSMKKTVKIHRSRDYWDSWCSIQLPTLLIRGEKSKELREEIAIEMRLSNRNTKFQQIDGVGHNIPLQAPRLLANILLDFWKSIK
jgi:esterase